jgi:two-component system sensor histidine kinase DesK
VAVAAVLAGAVILTLVSPAGVFPFYYAVIVAGAAFRWRIGVWLVAGVTVITIVTWYWVDDTISIQVGLIAALFGSAAVTVRRVVSAQVALNRTQEDLHRLASVEARMDFARDLHDQLGQELTTTILQAELLRLDLQDADPDLRARADDVVQGTRNSLRLMRESVTGARPPLLRTEEPLSRRLLESVGIACTLEASIPVTQPSNQALLGWVLRESVTNVLRHSNATQCVISLSSESTPSGGTITLQVRDDGGGHDATAWGSGLSGMRERVEAVDGVLSVDVPSAGGWRVSVTIPEPS